MLLRCRSSIGSGPFFIFLWKEASSFSSFTGSAATSGGSSRCSSKSWTTSSSFSISSLVGSGTADLRGGRRRAIFLRAVFLRAVFFFAATITAVVDVLSTT
ncbi:MAG: hypothetical protein ACYS0F_20050 [Planctomycetota bacterium]|jgi:hypothetical protein